MRQVPTQAQPAPLAPPPEHSVPLPPQRRQHVPQPVPLRPAIRYSSAPWHTAPLPVPQPRQRGHWPRANFPAYEGPPRPGARHAGCDAPPGVDSLPASKPECQHPAVNFQMALGEDSPIYSKPDSLLLQHNRCKLLAGGHENSCGRPDIPGTEEKQVAEKKKCAKKHLSQRQPARAWSERSAFLCSQSNGNHVLLRCTLCYR
jgi:hypothetical protein